jgi:hypothetical protein
MNEIHVREGLELAWEALPGKGPQSPRYALCAGGDVYALLESDRWESRAAMASARGCWLFEQSGIWRSAIEIKEGETGHLLATYYSDRRAGGRLEFVDGRELRYEGLGEDWLTLAAEETWLRLCVTARERSAPTRARLRVEAGMESNQEWLLGLAWYLRLMAYWDEETTLTAVMITLLAAVT